MPTDDLHSLTLVLSGARSGSTLLCRDIASLGGLGSPREYLRGLDEEARRGPVSEADVLERVARGVQETAPGVAAVKLVVAHSAAAYRAINGRRTPNLTEAMSGVVGWARERFDRVLLVFLFRNAVDQAISRAVAHETGVFHSSDSGFRSADAVPPGPDVNRQILDDLGIVLRSQTTLRSVLAEHADIALALTYDELTSDVDRTTSKLVAHARAQGFQVHRDSVTRRLTKVISPEHSDALRESFLDYLRTETGQ